MLDNSIIEEYLKQADFGDNKLQKFIFKSMAEAKENVSGIALSAEQLERFKQSLIVSTAKNKFTEHHYFNLALAYRLATWEREHHQNIPKRERRAIENELAKELGVEDKIRRYPTYIIAPKNKIIPDDIRKSMPGSSNMKRKYNALFKDLADGDKRVITGFKKQHYHVNPMSKKALAAVVALTILGTAVGVETLDVVTMNSIKYQNAIQYETQIQDYESRMNEYAKQIRNMGLNDIQTFMKVIDDMHTNTQGYDDPEINAIGFFRLDVGNSDGYGVCRNMADNTTYILNQINPQYNARNMLVDLNADGMQLANIERQQHKDDDTFATNNEKEADKEKETENSKTTGLFEANHMVTVVDIPGEDYSLVLDTTNPAIGVLADGKILMLNKIKGSMDYKPAAEALLGWDYQMGMLQNLHQMNSNNASEVDIEQLNQMWGIEAQNTALEQVRQMPNALTLASIAYHTDELIPSESQVKDMITLANSDELEQER